MTRYNIDSCAMLVEFNASVWTARKLDKNTTEEVVSGKNAASKDAARVNKHLLAGRTELAEIQQFINNVRTVVYDNTLPWSDSGIRLLPSLRFMDFNDYIGKKEQEFYDLVENFKQVYPSLITAQAMALGDMFNRNDYPDVADIGSKFAFRINYMPVPKAGDFRVDVGNDAQKELQERLSKLADERVEFAMKEAWTRLHDHLKRMTERLAVDNVAGEIKKRKFHNTLVTDGVELCSVLKSLNVIGDSKLEAARLELERALRNVDAEDLRENLDLREHVKTQVDSILDKFAF
jgi:hypothetical protein